MVISKSVIALSVISLTVAITGYFTGRQISFEDQLKLVELLITFASVVFAVVGVWLAVVFPDVMTGIYKRTSIEQKRELLSTAKRLLVPLFLASFIAAASMFVRIVAEPLKSVTWIDLGACGHGLLFAFILCSMFYLFVALIFALAPGLQLLFDGMDVVKSHERRDRYLSGSSQKKE